MKDRDVPEAIWNNYLKKQYHEKFRIRKDESGVWNILGKRSSPLHSIQLYSLEHHLCCAVFDFKSNKGKNILIQKLPPYCEVTQDGDAELTFKFPEEKLQELIDQRILTPYQRKQYTEEERAVMRERGRKLASAYGFRK